MNCKDCCFYQHDGHYGSCKRYPKVEVKSGGDWCGEFKQIVLPATIEESGFVQAITVDEVGEMMKPKRGRPAKEQK